MFFYYSAECRDEQNKDPTKILQKGREDTARAAWSSDLTLARSRCLKIPWPYVGIA